METIHQLECAIAGRRLDVFLAESIPELTRSRAQKLIDQGLVQVNGKGDVKASLSLEVGDRIEVKIPAPVSVELKPENIPLTILHEDEELIVIDKQAGLVVHPASGNWEGTLVQALLHHCGGKLPVIGGEMRPGIVHRIDKNTSGILVVAKTDRAHQSLSTQFKEHSIDRRYTGLAWGPFAHETGEFTEALGRDPRDRKRMWVKEDGKTARTAYTTKQVFRLGPEVALVLFEAKLFTGRTHQIRVHFSYHGYPLAGDATYTAATRAGRGRKEQGMQSLARKKPEAAELLRELLSENRQFLHASHLSFTHPVGQERLSFTSSLPTQLSAILNAL